MDRGSELKCGSDNGVSFLSKVIMCNGLPPGPPVGRAVILNCIILPVKEKDVFVFPSCSSEGQPCPLWKRDLDENYLPAFFQGMLTSKQV